MKGKIQTVLGLIDPENAGFTLPHEHLIHDLPKSLFKQQPDESLVEFGLGESDPVCIESLRWVRQYPYCFDDNLEFCDEATRNAVKNEMFFLKNVSGKATVVDNSPLGLRAKDHAEFLKTISTAASVNIVMGTGFYVAGSQASSTLGMTQEEMENLMRDDILKGIGPSGVKCGVIGEIGCSWPLLPFEKRSLVASAAIQQETGCPVIMHPGRNKDSPEEIIRIFQEAGGKVGKTVMSHLDRTFLCDAELAEFASLGSYCEFDLFGIEVSHYQLNEDVDMLSDAQRIARLRHLVEQGYGDKILASHDVHTKHRLQEYGGHGYSHLFVNVLPKMRKRNFTEEDIRKIFFLNPSKWLTFE